MKKEIYWYDKVLISLTVLFLIILCLWAVIVPITRSKSFYEHEFKKNYTTDATGYTEEELSIIADKIVDFLFNKTDSMQVEINGNVVFTQQALIHMTDVRTLYNGGRVIGIITLILTIAVFIYFGFNFKRLRKYFLRYSLIVFLILMLFLFFYGIYILIDFDSAFDLFHKLAFPDPQKYKDAFFGSVSNYPGDNLADNLMLIKILSIGLFVDVAIIIGVSLFLTLGIWFGICFYLNRKYGKEKGIYA